MASAQQEARQLRPIYEALDTGNFKLAVQSCNKILKKQPAFDVVKALKALALGRNGKLDEANTICNELLASKPTDELVLSALSHVLRAIGRPEDMTAMYDDAFKKKPNNEELGAQTFMANVRVGQWKTAQQVALKMFKQFKEDRFLFWSIMSSVLQAEHSPDVPNPEQFRSMLFTLAHRLLQTHPMAATSSPHAASLINPDRLFLHLTILLETKQYDEALALLDTEAAKNIFSTSLVIQDLRKQILMAAGKWDVVETAAKTLLTEKNDRNWLVLATYLDCIFNLVEHPKETAASPEEIDTTTARVQEARNLLLQLASVDGTNERGSCLALIELESRVKKYNLSREPEGYNRLLQEYFEKFGDKVCCFDDLLPYLDLNDEERATWSSFLEAQTLSTSSIKDLNRTVNIFKFRRVGLSMQDITVDSEATLAYEYYELYLKALPLGEGLPLTELQPADDLAILACQAFVSAWHLVPDNHQHLLHALCVSEYASLRSKHSWKLRLLLTRLHRLLGAPGPALEHYRALNVKQVQNDTLSHYILARASTFSLAHNGDLTMLNECLEASHVYSANSTETVELIVQTFQYEKYSQIQDFITFEDRLDNSLQRDLVKMEHVRMRFTCEAPVPETVDMELIELKFIFERTHHDNRDFSVLPDFQPRGQTFERLTALGSNSPGLGWFHVFLKIYIRILGHASDAVSTPEEAAKEATKITPLLTVFPQEELDELTDHEKAFLTFTRSLSDWLEPHHVAAKAATKPKETPTNGNEKTSGYSTPSEELPPNSKEIPQDLLNQFEDLVVRFDKVVASKSLPWEIMHVASLINEAFILFNIETLRFNPASGAKTRRSDPLVQNVKTLRTKGLTAVKHVADECIRLSEQEGTQVARQAIAQDCASLMIAEISDKTLDHDFAINVAKKVTDSRKKILDGIGKGIIRTCNS